MRLNQLVHQGQLLLSQRGDVRDDDWVLFERGHLHGDVREYAFPHGLEKDH